MNDLAREIVYDAIDATASTTAAPSAGTEPFFSHGYQRVRTLLAYSGTVSTCALKIWFRDPLLAVWYEGATTDDLDALTPGGASPVNEARDWDVGSATYFVFQVSTLTGGGTVAVRVARVLE